VADNLKTKCCLIADNGLFAELALRLARDFGQVFYFTPWISAYPKAAPAFVGTGLADNVERIHYFWDHVPDADVVVFPDVYMSDMAQVVNERFHKPVWSHRKAEAIELDRRGMRVLQRELGIPAPKTRFFNSVDDLAHYLEHVAGGPRWVKISAYRGDGETWQHTDWHISQVYLNHFRSRVGALANQYEFLVEQHLDGVEVGYDGWTVHGDYPEATFWGFEVKDKGYVGKFAAYDKLPEPIRYVNQEMAPVLREERAVGFCSFEFRYNGDGKAYVIDPCMRAGSPPFEGTQEAYDNLSEIIWEGSHNRMARPQALGQYLAMAMVHSEFALQNWVPIECPKDVRRWFKLRNAAMIDGKLYHVPTHGEMPEIGAVIAVSDDLEEAKRLVKERAEQVKGFNLEIHAEALSSAEEEIQKAKEYGIDF
jgi:hypothetical protein